MKKLISKKKSSMELKKENNNKLGIENLKMKEEIFNYYGEEENDNENFGSKSWQKYCNITCPELFDNFLNVNDFKKSNDEKIKDKVFKKHR